MTREGHEHATPNAHDPDRQVNLWLFIVSVATLAALLTAFLRENVFAEWRTLRRRYRTVLQARATDQAGRAAADEFRIRIEQSFLPDLDRVDRCPTCHAGILDPRMVDLPQPFTTHPGRHLDLHDPAKFGCTVCHEGQGRATETSAAHGYADHWARPLLQRRFIATTCTKCHADAAVFAPTGVLARADVRGAGLLRRGWSMLHEQGCLGCHVLDDKGGVLGPDLSLEGEKTAHELDFRHLPSDEPRRVDTWLFAHFVEPARVAPGTMMPAVPVEDARALTAALLSRRRKLASGVTTIGCPSEPSETATGAMLYATYCSACHGRDGDGGVVEGMTVPTLSNVDFLAAADDEHVRAIITHGVPGTHMPGWGRKGGNLSADEITRIVGHVRSWEPEGPTPASVVTTAGDASRGAELYGQLCSACHGHDGNGALAGALRSFPDEPMALARSIIEGDPRAGMPSWRSLTAQEVADLITHLRGWTNGSAPSQPSPAPPMTGLVAAGRASFEDNCSACHGPNGRGAGDGSEYAAPSLNNQAFLSAASDGYLMATIVRGRRDTMMFAYGPGTESPVELSPTEIRALVAFLRSWASVGTDDDARSNADDTLR